MKAVSPGKIILSGEHSVVHGAPAVAMAIDKSATAELTPSEEDGVQFAIQELPPGESFTLHALHDFKDRVTQNYAFFQEGKLGVRDIITKPIDLFKYAYVMSLDALHHKINEGVCIKIRSNIPIGCGMGSSAATVLSELRAIGRYLRVDFQPDWYYEFSMEAEKMQHGNPSGVDSYISLNGGAAVFQDGKAHKIALPRMNMFLVETGTPLSTTGECVMQVDAQFAQSKIWNDFSDITKGVELALVDNNEALMRELVRENHRLLNAIGVVPEKVQQFIKDVESSGGAAKICGAGAVHGEAGGVVLVFAETMPVKLAQKYGYKISTVRGDPLGTRVV